MVNDFFPITLLAYVTNTIVLHPAVPANNVGEFIAYAKANSGKMLTLRLVLARLA